MELLQTARVIAVRTRFAATSRLASHIHRRAGESQLRVLPNERPLPRESDGAPLPDSTSELPPIIRRAEVVAFALVALLLITVVAVLYAAKAFFLPVVTAFVVGTMLSPAAGLLERHRIPRAVSAVLIVGAATGIICAVTGMPNPAGLGALAATLNFFPIIGPVAMFVILTVVGVIAFSTLGAGLIAPLAFVGLTFLEGHFVTPAIIGRRLELNALAVFIALAFWTWLWGPMGGFLSSPLLIVALILKDHLMPDDSPQLPQD